jgi:gamma-glutamyltranspeptidase/glutathione hydrolase
VRTANAERRTQNAEFRRARATLLHSAFCVLRSAFILSAVALPLFAGSQVTARKAALSTAHPLATRVGINVLQQGGNAIDASVAVAFTLAVAHPQAGNLGGGGFLVYYDAKSKGIWTLDFREVAPLAAKKDMFAKESSVTGPLAAGVPGTVAGLEAMYKRFGSRPWKELLDPAIRLAREGVKVDEELTRELTQESTARNFDRFTSTTSIFFANRKPLAAGATLVQNDLAATLERIAASGAKDFYDGETGKRLVENSRAAGGMIGFRDLRDYQPMWRAPIRIRYGNYDVYTMAPPAAGGLVIGEALNILSGYDLAKSGFQTTRSLHLILEAQRRAYIDRNKYLSDPVNSRIPYREILSNERAAQWRRTIGDRVTPTSTLTEPNAMAAAEGEHTTHFTIADAQGNVAAITTTLSANFGSGFVVPGTGILLNAAMDDFSSTDGKPNREELVQGGVNAIEPGKRMASSMAPTIVLRNDKPFLALGTRGGPAIPNTILQVFLNVAVYGKPLQEAVAAPRWHQQAIPDVIAYELGLAPDATLAALTNLGHPVAARDSIGDVHALLFDGNRIIAVADPRRGGAAGGF